MVDAVAKLNAKLDIYDLLDDIDDEGRENFERFKRHNLTRLTDVERTDHLAEFTMTCEREILKRIAVSDANTKTLIMEALKEQTNQTNFIWWSMLVSVTIVIIAMNLI